MGNQSKVETSKRICVPKKEEKISEGTHLDFVFQRSIWQAFTGDSLDNRLHVASIVATDDGSTCSFPSDYMTFSNTHPWRLLSFRYQRWSGSIFQVPQERLLDAIHSVILKWEEKHSDAVLCVDTPTWDNPVQLPHVGKFHKAPKKTRVITPTNILPIVQASLHGHNFWSCQCQLALDSSVFVQFGSYTLVEWSWAQVFEETLGPPTFPIFGDQICRQPLYHFPWLKDQRSIRILMREPCVASLLIQWTAR